MKLFQLNFLCIFALLIVASVNCQEEPNDVEPIEDDENDVQPPTVAPDQPESSNSTKNETERDYPEEEPETYEENKPENQPENEVIDSENKRNDTENQPENMPENPPENIPEEEPEEEPEENPENKFEMGENMPENPEGNEEQPNSQPQQPPFLDAPNNFHRPDLTRPFEPMTPLGRYPPLFRTLGGGGGRSFRAADNHDNHNLNNYEVNRIFIVTIHDPLENFTKAERYQQYMQDKILLDLHRLGMVIEDQMKASDVKEDMKTKMESMMSSVKQFADLLQANELFNITKIMGQHFDSNRRISRLTPTITVNTNHRMAAPTQYQPNQQFGPNPQFQPNQQFGPNPQFQPNQQFQPNPQFQQNHQYQPPVNYDQYEQ